MALKISLKPGERMIVGGAVVRNGTVHSDLIIENIVPILREKDILSERDAVTPCRRIYFVIQLLYVNDSNVDVNEKLYRELVKDVVEAAPSVSGLMDQINEQVGQGRYYQALKLAKQLLDFEQEVLHDCESVASL
jgi:flagellar biosynthesis repressor protein FlbT